MCRREANPPSSVPPTGAGKTIVGEFGIYLALRRGAEILHDPIKALSNQKYHDFVRARTVAGLRGSAFPAIRTCTGTVVVTTEVLRKHLYANSTTLTGWAVWSWMRCTTWRTVSAAQCGKRRSPSSM